MKRVSLSLASAGLVILFAGCGSKGEPIPAARATTSPAASREVVPTQKTVVVSPKASLQDGSSKYRDAAILYAAELAILDSYRNRRNWLEERAIRRFARAMEIAETMDKFKRVNMDKQAEEQQPKYKELCAEVDTLNAEVRGLDAVILDQLGRVREARSGREAAFASKP